MHLSRPPNRSDGSTAVTATEESGDPPSVGAAGTSAQSSRSNGGSERSFGHPGSAGGGEPVSPSRCRTKAIAPLDSLSVFHTRSIFHLPRRSSSGYFSNDSDSVPSSPLSPRPVTADKVTQTPSPSSQVMNHALQCMAEAHGGRPGTHRQDASSPSPSSARQQNAIRDMQAEAVGRELRRIGDDYNNHLLELADRRRRVVPRIHQELTIVLCVGILVLVIGQIILQGSINSQDNSQV
uniref:Bcl-x interacting BH3 domain-containing protein n=1 Tax=Monopterus albus TaxID=43700 RepID=A0A3Q3K6I5_MONAL|nr:bcl-2-like protein 11 isoform X2 [Monopterus albus]